MTLTLELHPEALAESEETARFYAARDATISTAFTVALESALFDIMTHPEAHPAYLHGTRRLVMGRFPFSVVYSIEEGSILLIALAHMHRRPGYWRGRLRAC